MLKLIAILLSYIIYAKLYLFDKDFRYNTSDYRYMIRLFWQVYMYIKITQLLKQC